MHKQDLKNEMLREFQLTLPNGKVKQDRKGKVAEVTFEAFWDGVTEFPRKSKKEIVDDVRYTFGLNFIAWWLIKYFVTELINYLYNKYSR